jgi:AmmeMemoRadiSam system protein A
MSSLVEPAKKALLEVARRALLLAAQSGESLPESSLPSDDFLARPGGAFVTLRVRGRLRGCIGQLPSAIPLVRVVAHCTKAAALEDPRFQPVRSEEVPQIDIELSILSEPEDISPERIQSGLHGLIVTRGDKRGVLLPQVAKEFRWSAERFLTETCVKAGLKPEDWKDSATRVQAFTAEIVTEKSADTAKSGGS